MSVIGYNQKKFLSAFERFYGFQYSTNNGKDNNIAMHVYAEKMCYLLKMAGVEMDDYDFSWNLTGPFSPGLLAFLRRLDRAESEVTDFYKTEMNRDKFLTKSLKETVDDLRQKLEIDEHEGEKWVELLSSLAYISSTVYPGADFETVNERLVKEKSEFKGNDNQNAWVLLTQVHLVSAMGQAV